MTASTDIRGLILERVAELTELRDAEVSDNASLESLGLDSSDAVVLAMEVEEKTGREIDVAIFMRHETLGEAIADIERLMAT